MKITVFTGNQPRHADLVRRLTGITDEVVAVIETTTVFPGQVDDFFKKSEVMREYFSRVIAAERRLFGDIDFLPTGATVLPIRMGDVSQLTRSQLDHALDADVHIVFGASYIRGWLAEFLVSRGAINIHMGVSPYYRGSSCNFWALYDENPGYVGSTIHLLSKGLDNGDIFFHCMPRHETDASPFEFTMRAVLAAHEGLVHALSDGTLKGIDPIPQDRQKEVRYTRNRDFNDDVAAEFLARDLNLEASKIAYPVLLRPYFA